jgi:HAD superfamily hydrolase (TIGR01549 family)
MFDLDDTLIAGREMFHRRIRESLDYIGRQVSGLDMDALRKRHAEINIEAFSQFSVQPKRWAYVFTRLSEENPGISQEIWDEGLRIINQLYQDIPKVLEGTIEVLSLFRQTEIKLILVTHASDEWTEYKLRVTGLKDFFDAVVCVNPSSFKTEEAWLQGARAGNVLPTETAVVGDNLKGDIISARKAGVRELFWIDSGEKGWIVYTEGNLPDGAKVIGGIYELLDCIATVDGVT